MMLSSKSEITSLSLVIISIVTSLNASLPAEPHNPNTDWFMKAGYGVFVHYLWDIQNKSQELHSLGKETSWDECVQEFDAEKFADLMDQVGAGYVIFTMHQRTRFLIAPNGTFDRLTGYRPGQACATRDLVEDLYVALHRKNIPLMLYVHQVNFKGGVVSIDVMLYRDGSLDRSQFEMLKTLRPGLDRKKR